MKKSLECQRFGTSTHHPSLYYDTHRGRSKGILKLTSALIREILLKRRNLRLSSSIYLRSLERVL